MKSFSPPLIAAIALVAVHLIHAAPLPLTTSIHTLQSSNKSTLSITATVNVTATMELPAHVIRTLRNHSRHNGPWSLSTSVDITASNGPLQLSLSGATASAAHNRTAIARSSRALAFVDAASTAANGSAHALQASVHMNSKPITHVTDMRSSTHHIAAAAATAASNGCITTGTTVSSNSSRLSIACSHPTGYNQTQRIQPATQHSGAFSTASSNDPFSNAASVVSASAAGSVANAFGNGTSTSRRGKRGATVARAAAVQNGAASGIGISADRVETESKAKGEPLGDAKGLALGFGRARYGSGSGAAASGRSIARGRGAQMARWQPAHRRGAVAVVPRSR